MSIAIERVMIIESAPEAGDLPGEREGNVSLRLDVSSSRYNCVSSACQLGAPETRLTA
jgi:hypothetical protein